MVHHRNWIILAAVVFTLIAFIPSAQAGPPLKEGNPGLPGCLAKVNQLEQIIADQNLTILDLQEQINTLQVLLDSMKNYGPVSQTGQKIIYNPGDDGDLQKGVAWPIPRFEDNGDGTVTDNLTGLMWTKDSQLISANRDWYDALNACNNLSFAEYDDWRLPNINELLSLVDWGSHPHLPPDNPFVNVWYYEYYWSSTSEDSNTALTVGFSGASIVHVGKTYAAGKYVWCARGGK